MSIIRSIYCYPQWGKLQEKKEGGISKIFKYESKSGAIEYPFIMRKAGVIDNIQYYDIVTARGENGPIVIREENTSLYEEYDHAFQKYCRDEKIIAEYIRFDPWNAQASSFSTIYNIISHGFAYCNYLKEDFFVTQYSSKRRNQIRKALNKGVSIETDASWDRIRDFIEIYQFTVNKYEVSSYYILDEEFLNSYKHYLGSNVKLGLAYYQDKIIAAGLFINGGDIYHYHFSASNPEYNELNALSLLLYEEAKLGAKEGCSIMDLGGATPNSGLERFKKSMVKENGVLPCYVGTKIRDSKIYYALVEINGKKENDYFPAYRN